MSTGCSDILDRPSLTEAEDATYWTSAEKVALYANDFYPVFFTGYGTGWSVGGAAGNFTFSDDVVLKSTQSNFGRTVPNETDWNYKWIRKANIMIEKLDMMLEKGDISEKDYNHWMGIAKFFRAWEYSNLVTKYGDIPYYDHVVTNADVDELFKDRDNRDDIMGHVLEDLQFAIDNVKTDDGGKTRLNKYIIATIASRIAMTEGSWQKYYYHNDELAKKMFQFAADAAQEVIDSGKYSFDTDFRNLFGSFDLKGCKECLMERKYSPSLSVTHCRASYCNLSESLANGGNLDYVKSFICTDGKVWQNSELENTDQFNMPNLVATRDSRFEGTFHYKPTQKNIASGLYSVKFIPREALKWDEKPAEIWMSTNNYNSYPVIRYAETVLNWIESKAELQTLGAGTVSNEDLNASINAIRKRPLAKEAKERGVKMTAPLTLESIPNDPARDPSVPALLWEIRRERRMEFFQENISRINDLKRWHKLEYMDTDTKEDLLKGIWIDFSEELPEELTGKAAEKNKGKLRVETADGKFIVFNGSNGSEMKGYFYPKENLPRLPYLNLPGVNIYLSPMGVNTMKFYADRGYTLTQTEGWSDAQ